MIRLLTGIFGLGVVSSVLLGFDFLVPILYKLNSIWGFLLLLIWITLLQVEDRHENRWYNRDYDNYELYSSKFNLLADMGKYICNSLPSSTEGNR